ncbi:AAA family ATPase [Candidatus Woesearchaeota archaeon]|nr:AAA family ATPase [Candidatus Woesearchaeota archaeon]
MIVAIVGMAGSGKTTVADFLRKDGWGYIRLGQLTLDIIKDKGLEPTEQNEKPIRESLRKEHGMAAYAILNFPKIDELLKSRDVIVDGLYSWEEYLEFEKRYKQDFTTLAIYASPKTRYQRLSKRSFKLETDQDMRFRPSPPQDTKKRDEAELMNLNKSGPIAMADYTIINESTIENLKNQVDIFIDQVKNAKR